MLNSKVIKMDKNLSNLERELDAVNPENRNILRKAIGWYFEPKSFERNGRLYESAGIKTFKKYCPTGEVFNKYLNYQDVKGHSTQNLMDYEKQTRIFEGLHIIGGAVFFTLFGLHPVGLVANTIINLYPVITQRYNRSRIKNIIERREAKVK